MFHIQGEDESSIKSLLKYPERQNALFELFKFENYIVYGDKINFGIEGQLTEKKGFLGTITAIIPWLLIIVVVVFPVKRENFTRSK